MLEIEHMEPFCIFELDISDTHKEYYLLDRLCEDWFSKGSRFDHARMKKRIIYVASSRNKIRRLQKYQRDPSRSSSSPTFLTIKQLFRFLYELLPADQRPQKRFIAESHALVILRHILIERRSVLFPSGEFSLSAETADFFVKWIRNIKEYNLNIGFGRDSIHYRDQGRPFDMEGRENRYNEHLLRALASIFRMYQEFLSTNELLDESDRKWWIIDHLKAEMVNSLSFYIEHLSILRTVEQSVFERIYHNANSVSLLDFSYPFIEKRFTTTGIAPKGFKVIPIRRKGKSKDYKVSLHVFQKREHEIDALARGIFMQETRGDVTIIAPHIDEYEPVIERIFSRYSIHPPFSVRRRLGECPIVKTCLSLLDLITGNFGRRAMVSFLLSPFISFLSEEEQSIVDRTTRDAMIASGDDWERFCEGNSVLIHINGLIEEFRALKNKRGLEFLSHYVHLLERLIVREGEESVKPMSMLLGYLSLLTREPLVATISVFGLTDFQRILSAYTETASISETTAVDERVSLFNIEEASGMNFDSALIIGLVEGNVPQSPQYHQLFSEKLLAEMGFPTYDLIYDLSKFNFQSIMQSAKEIRCSYYEKDEQGSVYLRSPFLHSIGTEQAEPPAHGVHTFYDWQKSVGEMMHAGLTINEERFQGELLRRLSHIREGIERFRNEKRLRNIEEQIKDSPPLTRYVRKRISLLSQNLSPFSLELYQQCPYSYFLRYIAGLQESDEPEQGIDRMIRGRVIHSILARFLQGKLSRNIGKPGSTEWENLELIARDTIKLMVPGARDRILLNLELTSAEYECLLRRYLDFEHSMHGQHRIEDIEWDFDGNHVKLTCGGDTLGFRGRIDRIDRLPEGLVVLDYKTGSKKGLPSDHRIKKGTSLQLPLYAVAVEQCLGKVLKTAYYLISSKDGIAVEERQMISGEQLITNIFRVWAHIKEMHFEPSPSSGCSTSCRLSGLCPEYL